jgi:FMN-dependent oxidoreductase (nitrilotriacetate monooxygenase family)
VLGAYDVYQGSADAALRHAVQAPLNDPLALVPIMSQATRHLGFGVTCALTYEHPYTFARRMSTLDHLTRGRIGWNIVTGYLDSGAQPRPDQQLSHDERYDLADEYMEVVYKLWEQSWDDDAVVNDKQRGVYAEPSRIHPINHEGNTYKVPGFHLSEPSPQRTPLLYQAGTSPRGTAFAASMPNAPSSAAQAKVVKKYADDLRAAVRAAGRDDGDLKIYAQALIITAPTEAEARAKHEEYKRHIDIEAALALLSGWTGVDFSRFPLDATIEYIDSDAGRSALASFSQADPDRNGPCAKRPNSLACGRGPVLVGDPRQVADQLESWLDDTGIDGFNLAFAIAHESMRDVVDPSCRSSSSAAATSATTALAPCAISRPQSPLEQKGAHSVVAHLRLRDVAGWRHALRQPHVAANGGAGADGDAAQDCRAGVDHHVVFDDRVARHALDQYTLFVSREALGAQRHMLVQAHALADDRGFADHHAGAMVDEEAGADLRRRVDVDAGRRMCDVRYQTRQERRAETVQAMGQAVVQDGDGARIAQHDSATEVAAGSPENAASTSDTSKARTSGRLAANGA